MIEYKQKHDEIMCSVAKGKTQITYNGVVMPIAEDDFCANLYHIHVYIDMAGKYT